MKRLVVTDSTADIPASTAKKYGIEVLPVNKEVFQHNFTCRDIHQAYFGPSITINAGPDAIGVMYTKYDR